MVTFRNGLNSQALPNQDGREVADVFEDETLVAILNLNGSEVVNIIRGGLNVNADRYTVIVDGDIVTFSQNVGGKG